MLFEDLIKKTETYILNEKYFRYDIPKGKPELLYDFYVLTYLNYLVDLPSKNFRDLNTDIEDSVKDAYNKLLPELRTELLDALFYSICAEMRHIFSHANTNEQLIANKGTEKQRAMFKEYKKYTKFHQKDSDSRKELTDLYDVKKPSSEIRTPETEKNNETGRNLSFKAANYAISQTNSLRSDFVEMSRMFYAEGLWNSSYGGEAWANICSGYLRLDNADKLETVKLHKDEPQPKSSKEDMGVAIDHVYDLQHNTDTVFNKLKSYYDDDSGYKWINFALEFKANTQTYYQLLDAASPSLKSMAMPLLYNKLGTSWEEHIKDTIPEEEFKEDAYEYESSKIDTSTIKPNQKVMASTTSNGFTSGKFYNVEGIGKNGRLIIKNDNKKPTVMHSSDFKIVTKTHKKDILPPEPEENLEPSNAIQHTNVGPQTFNYKDEREALKDVKKWIDKAGFANGGKIHNNTSGSTFTISGLDSNTGKFLLSQGIGLSLRKYSVNSANWLFNGTFTYTPPANAIATKNSKLDSDFLYQTSEGIIFANESDKIFYHFWSTGNEQEIQEAEANSFISSPHVEKIPHWKDWKIGDSVMLMEHYQSLAKGGIYKILGIIGVDIHNIHTSLLKFEADGKITKAFVVRFKYLQSANSGITSPSAKDIDDASKSSENNWEVGDVFQFQTGSKTEYKITRISKGNVSFTEINTKFTHTEKLKVLDSWASIGDIKKVSNDNSKYKVGDTFYDKGAATRDEYLILTDIRDDKIHYDYYHNNTFSHKNWTHIISFQNLIKDGTYKKKQGSKPSSNTKFKVGDKVKCIDDSDIIKSLLIVGAIYTIADINKAGFIYLDNVVNSIGDYVGFKQSRFEKVDDSTIKTDDSGEIKVGQTYVQTGHGGQYTVLSITNGEVKYLYTTPKKDNSWESTIYLSEFKKYVDNGTYTLQPDEPKKTKSSTNIKVGDKFENVSIAETNKGKIMEIVGIEQKPDKYVYKYSGGSGSPYKVSFSQMDMYLKNGDFKPVRGNTREEEGFSASIKVGDKFDAGEGRIMKIDSIDNTKKIITYTYVTGDVSGTYSLPFHQMSHHITKKDFIPMANDKSAKSDLGIKVGDKFKTMYDENLEISSINGNNVKYTYTSGPPVGKTYTITIDEMQSYIKNGIFIPDNDDSSSKASKDDLNIKVGDQFRSNYNDIITIKEILGNQITCTYSEGDEIKYDKYHVTQYLEHGIWHPHKKAPKLTSVKPKSRPNKTPIIKYDVDDEFMFGNDIYVIDEISDSVVIYHKIGYDDDDNNMHYAMHDIALNIRNFDHAVKTGKFVIYPRI